MKNKSTKILIITMSIFAFIAIVISKSYYKSLNETKDPRIVNANLLYEQYNKTASKNDFSKLLGLLDSIEFYYITNEHYQNSYERGVIENNRAAIYLTIGLFKDSLNPVLVPEHLYHISSDSLLSIARTHLDKSIGFYENWENDFGSKDKQEVEKLVREDFFYGLESYSDKEKEKFLSNRIKEIETAQIENKRRMSVSYTNLGVIERHNNDYVKAIDYYHKALDLWDRNLDAENNINILLGKPLKKRNFFQKLFPPDRRK